MKPTPREQILIYDTTLRDGAQAEGISFSVADKIRLAEKIDSLGVAYLEGGWPGSNPRDDAFFRQAKKLHFRNARLCAFGSTRRAHCKVQEDETLHALLSAETPVVTIYGKAWRLHVHDVLHVSRQENIDMIAESCAWLKEHGREVIFDAEHFFDGCKDDPAYAKKVIAAAVQGGAGVITLCDTNGGTLPSEIVHVCRDIQTELPENVILGIHCHNDSDLAVANSVQSVIRAGVRLIQGTINGFGERCGNANLCSIIPNLELKTTQFRCLPEGKLAELKGTSAFVDDLANVRHETRLPFVGDSAFAHKGGMHVNAVSKDPRTFEHIPPESVGNQRRILVSDLSGRSNLLLKAKELRIGTLSPEQTNEILHILKEKENAGYEYEAADASLSVLVHKVLHSWNHFFTLEGYRVIVEKRKLGNGTAISEATVKVSVNGVSQLMAAEGEGPVNALDLALRKALERFYPPIKDVSLSDFKVRILDTQDATASRTRVLIESTDGTSFWGTVGLSENIIQAAWEALVDSVEYALFRKNVMPVPVSPQPQKESKK